MTAMQDEVVLVPLSKRKPQQYLLDAYTRGRYAAQVGFRAYNPYRDQPAMADAWLKGWESIENVETSNATRGNADGSRHDA